MKFEINLVLGLQSHKSDNTPKELLNKINEIFCELYFRDAVFS